MKRKIPNSHGTLVLTRRRSMKKYENKKEERLRGRERERLEERKGR